MNVHFILEDHYGPYFIKALVAKKQSEGLFSNITVKGAKKVPISSKLGRIIKIMLTTSDKVVLIVDADGGDLSKKRSHVEQFILSQNRSSVDIVVLSHEIEDWICYSMNIPIRDEKPSSILKRNHNYEKYRLKNFASKIDCERLTACKSFNSLVSKLDCSD